jgi:hypothetical protein
MVYVQRLNAMCRSWFESGLCHVHVFLTFRLFADSEDGDQGKDKKPCLMRLALLSASSTSSQRRISLGKAKKMSTRLYKDAIEHLNTLQSNAATLDAVRASGLRKPVFAVPEMVEYLGRIGYTVSAQVAS